jgi:hypothetical protein
MEQMLPQLIFFDRGFGARLDPITQDLSALRERLGENEEPTTIGIERLSNICQQFGVKLGSRW